MYPLSNSSIEVSIGALGPADHEIKPITGCVVGAAGLLSSVPKALVIEPIAIQVPSSRFSTISHEIPLPVSAIADVSTALANASCAGKYVEPIGPKPRRLVESPSSVTISQRLESSLRCSATSSTSKDDWSLLNVMLVRWCSSLTWNTSRELFDGETTTLPS